MTAVRTSTSTIGSDVLSVLILLASAGAAVAAVVLPINQLTQPGGQVAVALTDPAQAQALGAVTGVPEGTWLEFDTWGFPFQWHVLELSWPLQLLTEASTSLLLACLAGAGFLLARVIRSIRLGEPFAAANPGRLRIIAALLLAGGIGSQYVEGFTRIALLEATGAAGATYSPLEISASLNLSWVFFAAVTLVLAQAFARGRALTEDVEGLV
jgi:hypothetical protein